MPVERSSQLLAYSKHSILLDNERSTHDRFMKPKRRATACQKLQCGSFHHLILIATLSVVGTVLQSSLAPPKRLCAASIDAVYTSTTGDTLRTISHPKFHLQLPTISVLTSFLGANEGTFLPGFLEDVRQQTIFPRLELLIGTTDRFYDSLDHEHRNLLCSFVTGHPNALLILFHGDPGLYGMWNIMIKQFARGMFVTNANMDDRRRNDAWQQKMHVLRNDDDLGVVSSTVYAVHEVKPWNEAYPDFHNKTPLFSDLASKPMLQLSDFFWKPRTSDLYQSTNFPHNNPMWRKSIHDAVGFFDTTYDPFSDFEFWLRCRRAGIVFAILEEATELYYENPASHNRRGSPKGNPKEKLIQHANLMYSKYMGVRGKIMDCDLFSCLAPMMGHLLTTNIFCVHATLQKSAFPSDS